MILRNDLDDSFRRNDSTASRPPRTTYNEMFSTFLIPRFRVLVSKFELCLMANYATFVGMLCLYFRRGRIFVPNIPYKLVLIYELE